MLPVKSLNAFFFIFIHSEGIKTVNKNLLNCGANKKSET